MPAKEPGAYWIATRPPSAEIAWIRFVAFSRLPMTRLSVGIAGETIAPPNRRGGRFFGCHDGAELE
jgi:hypothetical protein